MPAIFGITSGSWSDELAARIPSGTRIIVRTHHDQAGPVGLDVDRSADQTRDVVCVAPNRPAFVAKFDGETSLDRERRHRRVLAPGAGAYARQERVTHTRQDT
jgi:hypothetical protein